MCCPYIEVLKRNSKRFLCCFPPPPPPFFQKQARAENKYFLSLEVNVPKFPIVVHFQTFFFVLQDHKATTGWPSVPLLAAGMPYTLACCPIPRSGPALYLGLLTHNSQRACLIHWPAGPYLAAGLPYTFIYVIPHPYVLVPP